MKYELPISPEYIKHWGEWEAIREILQNALDADPLTKIREEDGWLVITNRGNKLEAKTLVLGISEKAAGSRGKFGEGYKLALLVLCRLGKVVHVRNHDELWTAKIEHSETFGTDILTVTTETKPDWTEAHIVWQVSDIQWTKYSGRLITMEGILPDRKGDVYVGGLYVDKVAGFKHGYSLKVGDIPLDRDRMMVKSFDLAYHTSRLWIGKPGSYELANSKEFEDAKYASSHIGGGGGYYYTTFAARHGKDAIPVSTHDEAKRVAKSGKKWVLVTDTLKEILRTVYHWFVPASGGPVERLERLVAKNYFADDIKAELEDIIKVLKESLGDTLKDIYKPVGDLNEIGGGDE